MLQAGRGTGRRSPLPDTPPRARKRPPLRVVPALPLLFLVVACRPDEPPTEPEERLDLSGTWTYNATDLRGSHPDLVCDVTGVTIELTHEDENLSGSTTGGRMRCSAGTFTLAEDLSSATIMEARLEGDAISFRFGGSWRHTGTITSSGSMGGSLMIESQQPLSGPWSAARSSATASRARN